MLHKCKCQRRGKKGRGWPKRGERGRGGGEAGATYPDLVLAPPSFLSTAAFLHLHLTVVRATILGSHCKLQLIWREGTPWHLLPCQKGTATALQSSGQTPCMPPPKADSETLCPHRGISGKEQQVTKFWGHWVII